MALREDIKQCQLSRHQIVGEMSHLLGASISARFFLANEDTLISATLTINNDHKKHFPACKGSGSAFRNLTGKTFLLKPSPKNLDMQFGLN